MSSEISFKKELIGNFGYPVWDNPTEAMVEAAFAHHNLKFRYVTTEVKAENLKAAFEGLKAMGYKGFNCTIPHKVAIIDHLDGLGESASIMEAVNCVVERDGKYIGENTDGKGFMESIRTVTDPAEKNVLIFGAGGAARAVSVELSLAGINHLIIVNRSTNRGEGLVELLRTKTNVDVELINWQGDYSVPADRDIVINCTSIGLSPDVIRVPVLKESLQPSMIVCDLIVNPPHTPFLQEAESQGCQILDGVGMLVNQGRIGIKYWSGVDVDPEVMRKKIEEIYS
ncbi:MAG: shikimate dehydrogenase [Saprospiraceae bacterium]|nr:shikimate dehydrogenase [Saprospiraceae bacterium]